MPQRIVSVMFSRSVFGVVCEAIHGIFVECAAGTRVLIWTLELMENEVKGTRIW